MKTREIDEALTDIDSKYILETVDMVGSKKKVITFRKRVSQLVASVAIVAVVMASGLSAVVAAGNIKAYDMLHSVYPQVAEKLTPVQQSCVSEGIELSVEAVNVHDDSAEIYVALKDLEGERIDETTDLFDSYGIETSADQIGGCEFISYDEETKTATYLIFIQNMHGEKIEGEKLKFSLTNLLLKKNYTTMKFDSLSAIPFCQETELIDGKRIYAMGGTGDWSFSSDYYAIKSNENNAFEPVNKIKFLGYGFVDGKLHIKKVCEGMLEYDNHVFLYLENGNEKIEEEMSFDYDDENGNRCTECVFDVSESEIDNYKLCGDFVTCDTNLAGDWELSIVVK